MTLDRACKLLGVTPTSTLSQIKSAHRQLVIEWHPDRLQDETEEVRSYATGKMAVINEAYSLMRNHLIQLSA
jgi:curved DNA-binding protein CbpA